MYIHGIDDFASEDVVRVDETFAPETTSLHVRPLGFFGMESYLLLGLARLLHGLLLAFIVWKDTAVSSVLTMLLKKTLNVTESALGSHCCGRLAPVSGLLTTARGPRRLTY